MKISKKGLESIKTHEGFRNHPYYCQSGVPTIGYGNTYYADGRKVKITDDPITQKDALELLLKVVSGFERAVNRLVKVQLSQSQFDALTSFIYNVGIGAFASSTLLKVINLDPYNYPEIERQFLRWNKSNGKPSKGLLKRRKSEFYLYKNG